MRAQIPNTPFLHPTTKDIHPAWREFLTTIAQWVRWGDGTPEGNETAPMGTLYLRRDGAAATTLYVKTTGEDATGWTAK